MCCSSSSTCKAVLVGDRANGRLHINHLARPVRLSCGTRGRGIGRPLRHFIPPAPHDESDTPGPRRQHIHERHGFQQESRQKGPVESQQPGDDCGGCQVHHDIRCLGGNGQPAGHRRGCQGQLNEVRQRRDGEGQRDATLGKARRLCHKPTLGVKAHSDNPPV